MGSEALKKKDPPIPPPSAERVAAARALWAEVDAKVDHQAEARMAQSREPVRPSHGVVGVAACPVCGHPEAGNSCPKCGSSCLSDDFHFTQSADYGSQL